MTKTGALSVAAAAFTVCAFALPASAEVTGIEDKSRNSEIILVAEVTRVDPGIVTIKTLDVLKGGAEAKKVKRIGGEVGTDAENDFKKGEKSVLFIGELHEDIGVLFGGLDGKVDSKQSDLNDVKSAVKNVIALDAASGKNAKTALLTKMLATPGFQNRYIALNEVILRQGDYNVAELLKPITAILSDRSSKIREKAILATVRIYDIKAQGTSREEALLTLLLGHMADPSAEVREIAFSQFKSHSGNRSLSFDARGPEEDRAKQLDAIKKWMKNGKDKNVETEFE